MAARLSLFAKQRQVFSRSQYLSCLVLVTEHCKKQCSETGVIARNKKSKSHLCILQRFCNLFLMCSFLCCHVSFGFVCDIIKETKQCFFQKVVNNVRTPQSTIASKSQLLLHCCINTYLGSMKMCNYLQDSVPNTSYLHSKMGITDMMKYNGSKQIAVLQEGPCRAVLIKHTY